MSPALTDAAALDLAALTDPQAAGRLSGTPGARWSARYLAGALGAAGYRPAGAGPAAAAAAGAPPGADPGAAPGTDPGTAPGDSWFQPVAVPAARLTGPVRLRVGDAEFRHRADFAEFTALSRGGSVAGPLAVVRDGDALDPADLAGRVVLIPERPPGFDLAATAAAAADLGVAALLVEHGDPAWFHKTVYASNGRLPVLRVRTAVAAALARAAAPARAAAGGPPVLADLPLAVETRACHNVLGLLPGARRDRTVVLAAHYDHVGDDPGGLRFPGAEDNASGVAAVLAAARHLAGQQGALPFNILIAFLTGEESGLWGARHLAEHPPLPLSAVINVDGFGGEPELAAVRVGHRGPGAPLADLTARILAGRGAEPRWIAGHDDSAAFLGAGIPTVGLGQEPTVPSPSRMHTPDDTLTALHLSAVQAAAAAVTAIIGGLAADPRILEPTVAAAL